MIDLKGVGKHSNSRKCIHLARCSQVELDNYSSEKFFIKHSDGFTDDLIADSEPERAEWIRCICEVCGLSKWTISPTASMPIILVYYKLCTKVVFDLYTILNKEWKANSLTIV